MKNNNVHDIVVLKVNNDNNKTSILLVNVLLQEYDYLLKLFFAVL